MKRNKLLILLFVGMQAIASCQTEDYNNLLNSIPTIELPFGIKSFSDFSAVNKNEVIMYNKITKIGTGFIDFKDNYRKSTGKYSTEVIQRLYEKQINGEYKKYPVRDSTIVSFIGSIKLSEKFSCILVKIEDVPNNIQKAYYYKALVFDYEGTHLSTIKVFELIDDASTKDWMKEKPSPNITSVFKQDGSIIIKWDEGYDKIYLQHVRLNPEGVFHVVKLEEIDN